MDSQFGIIFSAFEAIHASRFNSPTFHMLCTAVGKKFCDSIFFAHQTSGGQANICARGEVSVRSLKHIRRQLLQVTNVGDLGEELIIVVRPEDGGTGEAAGAGGLKCRICNSFSEELAICNHFYAIVIVFPRERSLVRVFLRS